MFAHKQSDQPASKSTSPVQHGQSGHVPFSQPKLTVNQPGDEHEQEADRMADQVMRSPSPTPIGGGSNPVVQRISFTTISSSPTPWEGQKDSVQRSEMEEEEPVQRKEKPAPHFFGNEPIVVQRKCAECEKEGVQRKETSPTPTLPPTGGEGSMGDAGGKAAPPIVSDVLSSGGGQTLDADTKGFMESRFGQDFSQVRVHTDARAAESAAAVQARAYTSGRDVVFGAGEYQPESESGRRLLAHELVHVGQQGAGEVQRQRRDSEALAEKETDSSIQTMLSSSVQTHVQRMHIDENGRKKFDCPDFAGDAKLEACLNDEDRLRPLDTGASVTKIQIGLQKDGQDLGKDGTSGVYGADTGQAVMAFKRKHNLGSTQFPDVGPGTTRKLDELCVGSPKPVTPKVPKPKLPRPELPGNCGPGSVNPFCLPIPATDAPCQPFPDIASAEVLRNNMSIAIPLLTATDTQCPEVKPVWETYFAATSKPFPFSNASSCVVNAAKTDREASAEANRIAKGHLEDILDNLPITLRDITPSPFPFPGKPLAERRMPLEDAIPLKFRGFLHHQFTYNDKHNAAANIAGGTGIKGEGSDIFGDDDRLFGGTVIIEINAIDPTSGRMIGQVRWQPHIHVKDTVDFCPGNLTNSIILREFTIPMSKLEAMGLTRDVPITIDYDLDVQQANFSVLPLIGPAK